MSENRNSIADAHDSARMQFGKVSEAHSTVAGLRMALDQLMKLGDMVQPDDVIGEAGKLLGRANISAVEMAKFLSTMPQEGGQPLMGWLTQHEAMLVQMEQSTQQALGIARHRMGIAALHELASYSINQTMSQTPGLVRGGSTLAITTPQEGTGQ